MKNTKKLSLERKNTEHCNCEPLIDSLDSGGTGCCGFAASPPKRDCKPSAGSFQKMEQKTNINQHIIR